MEITMKDEQRIKVIEEVSVGRIDKDQAGRVLGRSIRQVNRLLKRLRELGIRGLVHGNKGKKSPRRIRQAIREKIVELARGRLRDINDTHLKEILLREEKIQLSRQALRKILRAAGVPPKLKRRSPRHRSRRERKEAFGMMLQIDGSPPSWTNGCRSLMGK